MNLDYIDSKERKRNVLSVTPKDELKQVTLTKKLIEEKKAAIAEAMKRIEEKEKIMEIVDSPAIKERSSVSMLMFTVILCLLPALLLQIGFFGYQILGNLFIGIGFALFLEAVCLKLRNLPNSPIYI